MYSTLLLSFPSTKAVRGSEFNPILHDLTCIFFGGCFAAVCGLLLGLLGGSVGGWAGGGGGVGGAVFCGGGWRFLVVDCLVVCGQGGLVFVAERGFGGGMIWSEGAFSFFDGGGAVLFVGEGWLGGLAGRWVGGWGTPLFFFFWGFFFLGFLENLFGAF